MKSPNELKGVAGWLAFFVVVLAAIGPAHMIISKFMELQSFERSDTAIATMSSWHLYKQYSWWIVAVVVALRLLTGLIMLKIFTRASVLFAMFTLWATPVIQAIGGYLALSASFGEQAATDSIGELGILLVKGLIIAAVWSAYLLRSKRVRNTYYQIPQPAV